MTIYVYDGSFEGLLSTVFQVFADKEMPLDIIDEHHFQRGLLEQIRHISTDDIRAERVLRALREHSDGRSALLVYNMFLSELPQFEMAILRFIKVAMDNRQNNILGNFANPHIAEALRISKMIGREVHRMHAFVRFEKSSNGLFLATINPDFNVLPLIGPHFEKRYADQCWLILDTLRHYALYYDLATTRFIGPDDPVLAQSLNGANWRDEKEDLYQQLWVSYFQSVNIQERNNTKLHLRHMPRRYWRFLIEKNHRTSG
jgi:probable DNA metabolism protein